MEPKKSSQRCDTTTYESPKGFHRHKCRKCGYIWEHGNTCVNDEKAHTCSKCGTEEWYWYQGPQAPVVTTAVVSIEPKKTFFTELLSLLKR